MQNKDLALTDFLRALKRESQGEIRTDEYSRVLYSTDASIYSVMPHGVFFPASRDDVQMAVTLAAKFGIPILPRTGGSSLAGQAVSEAVVMDFTRHLNRILEVNEAEGWVRAEPGLVLDQLNNSIAPTGLQFGPDPASSNRAALGGIVSNNSTGSHSICYGMTADHILNMNVVLSDGSQVYLGPLEMEELKKKAQRSGAEGRIYRGMMELTQSPKHRKAIIEGTPRHWRRCGGYNLDRFVGEAASFKVPQDERFNLAKLVCGAEGTLAVIQDVTLNLVPIPEARGLAIVHFGSTVEALRQIPAILEANPSAIELLDNLGLQLCKDVPEYARLLSTFIEGDPDCILITEFYGSGEAELRSKIEYLRTVLAAQGHSDSVLPVLEPSRQGNVWAVRKAGLGLLMSIKGDHKPIPFIEDAAVPTEHLAEYVEKIGRFCEERDTRVAYYAHASAGCVHIRPLINTKEASEIAKIPEILDFAVDLLQGYGGALSSEHGDGRARSWMNERFFGPDLYRLYQKVKQFWDPEGLLNQGVVVDAPAGTENLRYGPDYEVIPLELNLDFSAEHGFDRAVEMCNGAGICRKETAGVMCPSFMVTREEEHTTRGRANALRAALSGELPHEELTSKRMYEVMDLCVECKGCKSECPSSVDMAKIKFEFLSQYHKKHGIPLRTRMFGDIAKISRLTSGALAPIFNGVLGSLPVRFILDRALGISMQRKMPTFARQPFTAWFRKRSRNGQQKRQVVLFHDTFNTFNDPHVSIAAVEVLEAAGFKVILPGHRCCGRPLISKGLVKKARAAAKDTVERLLPYAKQGLPIIGLEPSCLLSMRDEYLYLLPESEDARIVASQAVLFDEFIARLAEEGRLPMTFTGTAKEVLLHGHCHQRALVGTEPTRKILTLPENYHVREVDSSCCGMAGAFGYEKEHYAISRKMAERRLVPEIRSAGRDALIVAPGTSCRHQLQHYDIKRVLHPAEVLRDAMILSAD
ncbi:MAG: FAD-binding protein [Rhodothermaceae bacterium]|nr:FAD-binding protein [Rhodothermaceae bacterium]MXZ57461.1 FAD-binding protein [Rhodothermaceae bacterium]MYB90445.1 FAD-binding protein [Rhodothermaceae bacterium]MYD68248.1 FAD-binding protein [Rhodothermaceae bacterium]MYG44238.1 FAD-binding protein [Rhodothermaceae bacterium]